MKRKIIYLLLAFIMVFNIFTPILEVVNAEEVIKDPVEVSIKAHVNYDYNLLSDKTFTFDLFKKGESEPLKTAVANPWGTVDFGTVVIKEPGEYTFEVVQRDLNEKNVDYDTEVKEFTIDVRENDFGHEESKTIYYGHSPKADFIKVNEIHSDLAYPVFCIDLKRQVPPNNYKKEYKVIVNPSNKELAEMVTEVEEGKDISTILKKAFFYFQTKPGLEIEGHIQREIIWALTGGLTPDKDLTKLINEIEKVTLPEDYNLVVFKPVEGEDEFQSLAMGYGSSGERVYVPGRVIAANIEFNNLHNPEISIEGVKTWEDNDNQDGIRPESITVNLLADGEKVDSIEVSEKDNWSWSFDNLPKYENGEEIKYQVTENPVEGYTSKVDGYDIVNTHMPETINIEGMKTWEDNDNQDGIRPESITVNLLANGEKVDSIEVSEKDNWSWSFDNLPKYENGEEIKYQVTEDPVQGYISKVDGYDITNTHIPETINIEGMKTWKDNDNKAEKRPETITVNLFANGKKVDSIEVREKDNWSWSFDNLDKYEDGKEIRYSISEDKVKDYTSKVDGYNLINTYNEKTSTDSLNNPKTSDDNNIFMYLSIILISSFVLYFVKKNKELSK